MVTGSKFALARCTSGSGGEACTCDGGRYDSALRIGHVSRLIVTIHICVAKLDASMCVGQYRGNASMYNRVVKPWVTGAFAVLH